MRSVLCSTMTRWRTASLGCCNGPSAKMTAAASSRVAGEESRLEGALIEESRPRQRCRHLIVGLFVVTALVLAGTARGYALAGLGGARPRPAGDANRSLSVPYAPSYVEPKAPGALAVGPNGNLFVADDTRDQNP